MEATQNPTPTSAPAATGGNWITDNPEMSMAIGAAVIIVLLLVVVYYSGWMSADSDDDDDDDSEDLSNHIDGGNKGLALQLGGGVHAGHGGPMESVAAEGHSRAVGASAEDGQGHKPTHIPRSEMASMFGAGIGEASFGNCQRMPSKEAIEELRAHQGFGGIGHESVANTSLEPHSIPPSEGGKPANIGYGYGGPMLGMNYSQSYSEPMIGRNYAQGLGAM